MTDINSVVIIGRLTSEPKLESVGTSSKCTFTIANNRSFKKGDEWVNEASYFDVVTWGAFADHLSSKLVKGEMAAIHGTLKQDRWEKTATNRAEFIFLRMRLSLAHQVKMGMGKKHIQNRATLLQYLKMQRHLICGNCVRGKQE